MSSSNEPLWVEKYRPKTVSETLLTPELRGVFQGFVDEGFVPNLLLSGGPGVGKTSVARALMNELGCDLLFENASNIGIDVLRTRIESFASSMSLGGGRKYVLFDEADKMSPQMQDALRGFIEEFSSNCGFIFTCNRSNRIIEAIHSRCFGVDFRVAKSPEFAGQLYDRVVAILEAEGVQHDPDALVALIQKYYPDARRIINTLQGYARRSGGRIDSGALATLLDAEVRELIQLMRKRDYTGMRAWVSTNSHVDQHELYRSLYDQAREHFAVEKIPLVVLALAKYQYQAAFAADAEINVMACLTEIMAEEALK